MKASLEKGAALETKTAYCQTPLYLAAMNGREDIARFLLEKGASTAVRDTFCKAIAWSQQRGGVYLPSPLVYAEQLYAVNNHGVMTVFDARTGNRVYQQRIGSGGSLHTRWPQQASCMSPAKMATCSSSRRARSTN